MIKRSPSKPLLLVFFLLMFAQPVVATHFMGGEITWECTPQGHFRFTMKLYRECYTSGGSQAANFFVTETMNTTVPGFPSIQMTRISVTDFSPQCGCPGGVHIQCPGMANGAANMGALEEHVYTSDATYPNGVPLIGVPPAIGWSFSNSSCCRNSSANIPGQPGWWIRAIMYPYQNTPVNTCFDHSPSFAERPASVFCAGNPTVYYQFATDHENDSLSFSWAQPYSGGNTPISNYIPGYSFNSPLPGPVHNPNNVAAAMDPTLGTIYYTSYTAGAFVTVTKVTAFKHGIRIAEVYREIQMVLTPCSSNDAPVLQIFPALTQIAPQHYHATVIAGDSIQFSILLNDQDTCPGTLQPNSISLYAYGEMFGSPINPGGCNGLPCATLFPSPTSTAPLIMQGFLGTTFHWQTSIDHLHDSSGYHHSKTYAFVIHYHDDHCPVPGNGWIQFTIEISLPFLIKPTELQCARVIPNGDVQLTWEPTTMLASAFDHYEIMVSPNPQGPFSTAATISNLSANTYTHTGAGANMQSLYYQLNTSVHTPLALNIPSAQNLSPIFLTVTPQTATTTRVILSWMHTHPNSPNGLPRLYEIFRDDGTGIWQLIGHTYFTTYTDYMPFLNQTVRYRVETPLTDPSGTISLCRSISNVASAFLSAIEESEETFQAPIIFPNPNHGTFMLDPGDLEGDAIISIVATNGSIVHQLKSTLIRNQPCSIEVPGLVAGNYMVNIITEQRTYALQMVIR